MPVLKKYDKINYEQNIYMHGKKCRLSKDRE